MKKLLLIGMLILSFCACNKESSDIQTMPADYNLNQAIDELPQVSGTAEEEAAAKEPDNVADLDVEMKYLTDKEELNEALLEAAESGNLQQAKELLDAGADINYRTSVGNALTLAVEGRHTEMVQLLLKRGANVNAEIPAAVDGFYRALDVARGNGDEAMADLLIQAGAEEFAEYEELLEQDDEGKYE